MNERLTELIKSTSAALASPSLAGASICTPTASSPISAEPHTHARPRLSKEEEEQQTAVTAEKDALELEGGSETDRTCDGGDLGAGLGVDGYGHGRRRHQRGGSPGTLQLRQARLRPAPPLWPCLASPEPSRFRAIEVGPGSIHFSSSDRSGPTCSRRSNKHAR